MAQYYVRIPIAGHVDITVEADSEKTAITLALEQVTMDHIDCREPLRQFNTGNIERLLGRRCHVRRLPSDMHTKGQVNVIEIPRLTMQQQVDTCQALLDMDDCQREGLVEGFGSVDRNKCLSFLIRAERKGYVPGDGRWAIGRGLLDMVGGKFTE